jgi:hypothetical protein
MTMAMHRARPMRFRPTMYSWWPDKKDHGQSEHEDRADDPVLDVGQGASTRTLTEDLPQYLVFHLGQAEVTS